MPIIRFWFEGEVDEETAADLDSADPALLHEYVPELAERMHITDCGYTTNV